MKAISNPRWANDPFAAALMPPPEESEDERAKRVQQQAEAARVSREIDEDLQETKRLIEKRKKATKVLLLGKLSSHPAPPPRSPHSKVKPSPARARLSRVSAPTHFAAYNSSSHAFRCPTPDFQLSFCPSQFKQERAIWKSVIQLNLIK
jgi:hypothetical protein